MCHHARACSRHMMIYAHLQPDLGELLYVWGCFPRLGGENDNTTLAKHLIECARSWSLQSDTKSQELPGFGPSGHNLATSKAYSKILRDSEERGSNGALNYISPSISMYFQWHIWKGWLYCQHASAPCAESDANRKSGIFSGIKLHLMTSSARGEDRESCDSRRIESKLRHSCYTPIVTRYFSCAAIVLAQMPRAQGGTAQLAAASGCQQLARSSQGRVASHGQGQRKLEYAELFETKTYRWRYSWPPPLTGWERSAETVSFDAFGFFCIANRCIAFRAFGLCSRSILDHSRPLDKYCSFFTKTHIRWCRHASVSFFGCCLWLGGLGGLLKDDHKKPLLVMLGLIIKA